MKQTAKASQRQHRYAALCEPCSNFRVPTRKQITPTDVFWLHDGIQVCGAEKEREKDWQADQKK